VSKQSIQISEVNQLRAIFVGGKYLTFIANIAAKTVAMNNIGLCGVERG